MNATEKEKFENKVEKALDVIRPYLIADGGNIELVGVDNDLTVKVKLLGACSGCPFSLQTLKSGVEQALKKEIPEIKEVVAV